MKLPPLVPAFKHRYVVFFCKKQPVWPTTCAIPTDHKCLHEVNLGGEISVEERQLRKKRILEELDIWKVDFAWESFAMFECVFDSFKNFGVQWEPNEFVAEALRVLHPMDCVKALPDELRFAVKQLATLSPAEIARKRADFFTYWHQRSKELKPKEKEMRASMDPVVSHAVERKKLALFAEMLEFYKYPDKGVVDELVNGASLVGEVAVTDMLPVKFSPALLTEDSLRKQSALRRPQVERDCKSSGDADVDLEVWQQTLDECEKGWLAGPFSASEVPLDAPVSKRFGLKQRHKVRLIDDFTEASVNQTVTVHGSSTLHTVDIAAASLAYWFQCKGNSKAATSLQVRTFDLSSAYRQIALCAEGRKYAYIRVFNPSTKQWSYFQALVLPFGAVKGVHSFLRLARAIWWLGSVACLLMWTSFYDDYIVFSPPELVRNSEMTAASLFELLGWNFAKEGRKCVPFGTSCEALGVIFDLASTSKGLAHISNTASRVEEIVTEISRVTSEGGITLTAAQKLRGRMQFAEAQLYGRTGKRCLRALRDACCKKKTTFQNHEIHSLKLFSKMLELGRPRVISWDNRNSLVIFTDACYERDAKDLVCGLGAVFDERCFGQWNDWCNMCCFCWTWNVDASELLAITCSFFFEYCWQTFQRRHKPFWLKTFIREGVKSSKAHETMFMSLSMSQRIRHVGHDRNQKHASHHILTKFFFGGTSSGSRPLQCTVQSRCLQTNSLNTTSSTWTIRVVFLDFDRMHTSRTQKTRTCMPSSKTSGPTWARTQC